MYYDDDEGGPRRYDRVREVRKYWRGGAGRPDGERSYLRGTVYKRQDSVWLFWMVLAVGIVILAVQGSLRLVCWRYWRRRTSLVTTRSWWRWGVVSILLIGTLLSFGAVRSARSLENGVEDAIDTMDTLVIWWQALADLATESMLPATARLSTACSSSQVLTTLDAVNITTRALSQELEGAYQPLSRYQRRLNRLERMSTRGMISIVVLPWFIFVGTLLLLALGIVPVRCYFAWAHSDSQLWAGGPSDIETRFKRAVLNATACWTAAVWIPMIILIVGAFIVATVYLGDGCYLGFSDILRHEDERNTYTAYYLDFEQRAESNPLAPFVLNATTAANALASTYYNGDSTCGQSIDIDLIQSSANSILNTTLRSNIGTRLTRDVFHDALCGRTLNGLYAAYVVTTALGVSVLCFLVCMPWIQRALRDDRFATRRINAAIGDMSTYEKGNNGTRKSGSSVTPYSPYSPRNRVACCCRRQLHESSSLSHSDSASDYDEEYVLPRSSSSSDIMSDSSVQQPSSGEPQLLARQPTLKNRSYSSNHLVVHTSRPSRPASLRLPAFGTGDGQDDDDDDSPASSDDASPHGLSAELDDGMTPHQLPPLTSRRSYISTSSTLDTVPEEDIDEDGIEEDEYRRSNAEAFEQFFESYSHNHSTTLPLPPRRPPPPRVPRLNAPRGSHHDPSSLPFHDDDDDDDIYDLDNYFASRPSSLSLPQDI